MNQNSDRSNKQADFRSRALKIHASLGTDQASLSAMSDDDVRNLIHELQVHQIEFELQNRELKANEERLLKDQERLTDLYDFAPVGYLTVDQKGIIQEANLTSTILLEADRRSLIHRPLAEFLSPDDADRFYLRLSLLFTTNGKMTFDCKFQKSSGQWFDAQLECVSKGSSDREPEAAKIIMMDIAARKEIEACLARQCAITDSMYALSLKFLDTDSMVEITNLTLDEALKLTGSKFGFAGYIDPVAGVMACPTLTTGIWESCEINNKSVVFDTFTGLWGWVLKNKTPLLTNAPHLDHRSAGIPKGHLPIHRFLSVPVMDGDRLVGQIAVANPEKDYTDDDMASLQQLAPIFSLGIKKKLAEEARSKLIADLEKAMSEIKTLTGFIPICAACKKIRDDKGYWHAVEVYIRDRTDAEFSHGICPDCARKLYPDYFKDEPPTGTQARED